MDILLPVVELPFLMGKLHPPPLPCCQKEWANGQPGPGLRPLARRSPELKQRLQSSPDPPTEPSACWPSWACGGCSLNLGQWKLTELQRLSPPESQGHRPLLIPVQIS
jgi:hypothetical protein